MPTAKGERAWDGIFVAAFMRKKRIEFAFLFLFAWNWNQQQDKKN